MRRVFLTVLDAVGCGALPDAADYGDEGANTIGHVVDAVHPDLAVIQVGEKNLYGHPAPEVLQRLSDRRIKVLRNDLQGAVGLKLRNGSIREIRTMMGQEKHL